MTTPVTAPYGSWSSEISASRVARAGTHLVDVALDGESVYWLEARPAEGGRAVLVQLDASGAVHDVTPPGFYVRTRVHEYGGGAFHVADGTVFFSNFEDQRLYRQAGPGAEPRAITPEPDTPAGHRYADARLLADGITLVCVRERHSEGEVVNEIVTVPADGSREPQVLITGRDFYASPRVSLDGRRLAWTTWGHPNMPWDASELWIGELSAEGSPSVASPRRVAGGPSEAAYQPLWAPDGTLYFLSEASGWLNVWRLPVEGTPEPVLLREAEFGWPQWGFDSSSFAWLADGRLACTWTEGGLWRLGVLDPSSGTLDQLPVPYTSFGRVRSRGMRLATIASGPRHPAAIVTLDVDRSPPVTTVLRTSTDLSIDPASISVAEPIEFPTDGGLTAHALLYRPTNPDFTAPGGERPPLLVMSHGGPTSAASPTLDVEVQFWTTRGFAVVDVNYGGSSGYGRAYRERLNGRWGVVDVADCVNAARHLAAAGIVDPARMAIRGGSAGGYTTLAALTFYDDFAAGASYYGVADLAGLAEETHKFESHYLDSLVGPYPEAEAVYRERSPVHFTDRLSCPLILFQGLEDEVVPPSQAEAMVEALRAKGIPYAYLPFEGEQHGFRRAETIQAALEAELSFYAQVFGFEPADPIDPVTIVGLAAGSRFAARS